jgi:hypothetical protein
METPDQKYNNQLQDKVFKANQNDRAKNTKEIVEKLDALKPSDQARTAQDAMSAFVQMLRGEKGDKGEQGESGIQGEMGVQGENGVDGKDGVNGKDGRDGIDGKDGVDGQDGMNGVDGKDGKNGSPDTAEQIVEKLQTIKEAWVEISKIRGLTELLNETGNNFLQQAKGFVPRALASLYDVAITTPIDGQAIVYSAAKGKWVAGAVVSSSVGTGFTLLPATGTVNGTNTDFTFTQKPLYIVSDGAWYVEGAGWSWNGGTLTATMSVPPQTGIWGFV